jgi:hypothetical protein
MNKPTVALSLAAGLLGGVASRYLAPDLVHAQAQTLPPKEIRAQSFVLVNDKGVPFGLFGFSPRGAPVITLVDERGRVIWSNGPDPLWVLPSGKPLPPTGQ